MSDIFKQDKDFKEAIGAFIITFSELEFGLAILCSLTECDPRNRNNYLPTCIGLSFEQKRNKLSEYIRDSLPEIANIWDKINAQIGEINRERRFIAHGFSMYYLPNDNISTFIKEKGKIVEKKQSIDDIVNLTKRLYEINTGENGVNGKFNTLFTKSRIDKWNKLVNEEFRITYTVNSKIISEWKGIK